jgi:hypothetical protein
MTTKRIKSLWIEGEVLDKAQMIALKEDRTPSEILLRWLDGGYRFLEHQTNPVVFPATPNPLTAKTGDSQKKSVSVPPEKSAEVLRGTSALNEKLENHRYFPGGQGPHLLRDKQGNTAYCGGFQYCRFCKEGVPPTGDHQRIDTDEDLSQSTVMFEAGPDVPFKTIEPMIEMEVHGFGVNNEDQAMAAQSLAAVGIELTGPAETLDAIAAGRHKVHHGRKAKVEALTEKIPGVSAASELPKPKTPLCKKEGHSGFWRSDGYWCSKCSKLYREG